MLEEVVLTYYEYAFSQRRVPFLAGITGISERGIRKGCENGFRQATLERASAAAEAGACATLRQAGFSKEDITAWFDAHPRGLLSGLIYTTQVNKELEYPETIAFARRIDALGVELIHAREADDVAQARCSLLETEWLDLRYLETRHDGSEPDQPAPLMALVQQATSWQDLSAPAAGIAANLLFSLLALWDIEVYSRTFPRLRRQPVFGLLLPLADIGRAQANPRGRELIRLPVSRLIDLLYAMHCYSTYRTWPESRPELKELVPACKVASEGNLVNWRDGTKRFTLKNLEEIWKGMFAARGGLELPDIMPLYIATVIFQTLLVKVDTTKRGKEVRLHEDDYTFWWNEHLKSAARDHVALPQGNVPWPAWLSSP